MSSTDSIPEGWTTSPLGDICSKITDGTHKTPNYCKEGIPFISTANIKPFKQGFDFTEYIRFISKKDHKELTKRCFPERGDILLSKCGTIGRAKEVDVDYPFSIFVGLALLKPIKGLFAPKFLEYILNSQNILSQFIANSPGSTRNTLALKGIIPIEIPIPPFAEQQRIVKRIEELSAMIKISAEHLEKVSIIMKRFRQAVLTAACSGRLTETWRESYLNTSQAFSQKDQLNSSEVTDTDFGSTFELPELPDTWKWLKVANIASDQPWSIQSGPFGSNLLHSEFQDKGILVIGIDNVQNGHFSIGREHRISQKKYEELKKYSARPLDVLITVMATVGRCCVIPQDIETSIITKHVYRITVNRRKVNPFYLMRAFQGDRTVIDQIQTSTRGQTRPGINGAILKNIYIPIPPLPEQDEIVHKVDELFCWSDTIENHVNKTSICIAKLTQSILDKTFQGELVPTESELSRKEGRSYETASVLLERIKAKKANKSTTTEEEEVYENC